MSNIRVKLQLGSQFRRLEIPTDADYELFQQLILSLLEADQKISSIQYCDNEQDWITISNDNDWKEAKVVYEEYKASDRILRLRVIIDAPKTENSNNNNSCGDWKQKRREHWMKMKEEWKKQHENQQQQSSSEQPRGPFGGCGFGQNFCNPSFFHNMFNGNNSGCHGQFPDFAAPFLKEFKEKQQKGEFPDWQTLYEQYKGFIPPQFQSFAQDLVKNLNTETANANSSEASSSSSSSSGSEYNPQGYTKTPSAPTAPQTQQQPNPQAQQQTYNPQGFNPLQMFQNFFNPQPEKPEEEKKEEQSYENELAVLHNMGFVNREYNLELLRKYNGNINSVVNHLFAN